MVSSTLSEDALVEGRGEAGLRRSDADIAAVRIGDGGVGFRFTPAPPGVRLRVR